MTTRSRYVAGAIQFYDDVSSETMSRLAGVAYADDFLGAGSLVIPAAGSAESGVNWVKKIVGAGPPTVAGVASAVGGQVACTLAATSEKEDAVLYWGDQKAIDVTKGAIFEARFQLSVLPSAAGVQAVIGLASNWIDGPDNNTCYLQVGATANGNLLLRSFDGVTAISVATGDVLLTSTWVIVRIDATDIASVKIYVNGVKRTTAGQINFAATGALAVLQPYAAMYKPSGTGVGTLTADYVKAWLARS